MRHVLLLAVLCSTTAARAQSWDMEDSNHYARGATPQVGYGGSNSLAESTPRWASRTRTTAGPQLGSSQRTLDGRANPGFRESPAWNLGRDSLPKTFGQHYGTGYTPNYFGAFGQGYGIGYGHNYFGNPGQQYGTGFGPKF